jgi:Domain of unknown function (DUF4157)
MTAKVIQGSFLGGQPKLPPSVPARLPPPIQAKTAARPPRPPTPGFASRSPGPPAPAFSARPPGPPVPASAPRQGAVQRHGVGGSFAVEAEQLGLALGGGRPLPDSVRGHMEAALGADFGAVRVHVGPQAARIGAMAFTTGADIYFAPGRFQPDTVQGRQLLGHELAHVVQQRAGRVSNPMGAGVVQDAALEAEAERLGRRAASLRSVVQPKMISTVAPARPSAARPSGSHPRPTTLQPYFAMRSQRIFHTDKEVGLANLAGSDYPVAVVPTARKVVAQQLMPGASRGQNYEFLDKRPNVVGSSAYRRTPARSAISDDCQMAIEDTDLSRRQPKVFFATDSVIASANRTLATKGGFVTLTKSGDRISIYTNNHNINTLHRIEPFFKSVTPQNCNEMAKKITGSVGLEPYMAFKAAEAVESITGIDPGDLDDELYTQKAVRNYLSGNYDPKKLKINTGANPKVGEAYAIWTMGEDFPVQAGPRKGESQVYDIRSKEARILNWAYHFAGVVAVSGSDRITLENYARPTRPPATSPIRAGISKCTERGRASRSTRQMSKPGGLRTR